MKTRDLLPDEHASKDCNRAVFIFETNDGQVLLEATSEEAVVAVERLCAPDQAVSDNCRLVAIVRGYSSLGTRSDRAAEDEFLSFMLNRVDVERFRSDATTLFVAMCAMSKNERRQLSRHVDADDHNDAVDVCHPGDDVLKILQNLGFKKREVSTWAKSFDASNMNLSQIVKAGCADLCRVTMDA